MMRKNKRGWIKIIEAFIAILLIAGVLLVVIDKGYISKGGVGKKIYEAELSILREIELDDKLRSEILEIDEDKLPKKGPPGVVLKLDIRTPDYLECVSMVCATDVICLADVYHNIPLDKDVYSKAVPIFAELDKYSPRQLKLFCWTD